MRNRVSEFLTQRKSRIRCWLMLLKIPLLQHVIIWVLSAATLLQLVCCLFIAIVILSTDNCRSLLVVVVVVVVVVVSDSVVFGPHWQLKLIRAGLGLMGERRMRKDRMKKERTSKEHVANKENKINHPDVHPWGGFSSHFIMTPRVQPLCSPEMPQKSPLGPDRG